MKVAFEGIPSLFIVVVFGLSACNFGGQAADEVVVTEVQDVPIDTPVVEAIPDPTVTPVQHVMVPVDVPDSWSGLAGDQDSSTTAGEQRAPGGDRFTFGRYERPFNTDTMDVYHPYIDIINSSFHQDDTWYYGVITIKDDGSGRSLDGKYGFEIDLDVDGGGDWLVMAHQPASTEWTTDGVQVWFDEDDDVGGSVKVHADNGSFIGNGFETMVFDGGQGDDPDLAWVRIAPHNPYTVQIAVKRSLFGNDAAFMVGMWAGNELFDPALFDNNDQMTHEQAGSPLKEFEFFYPLKAIHELDNACRMAIGFNPSGGEPGLCPLPPRPEGEPDVPNETTCPPQQLVCFTFGSQVVCYCLQP
jgi:hypothetical protein